MKLIVQSICATLAICLMTKSFYTMSTYVDALSIICLVAVYCLQEFIATKDYKKELNDTKEDLSRQIDELKKDVSDTKNYVSKFSTVASFRR